MELRFFGAAGMEECEKCRDVRLDFCKRALETRRPRQDQQLDGGEIWHGLQGRAQSLSGASSHAIALYGRLAQLR